MTVEHLLETETRGNSGQFRSSHRVWGGSPNRGKIQLRSLKLVRELSGKWLYAPVQTRPVWRFGGCFTSRCGVWCVWPPSHLVRRQQPSKKGINNGFQQITTLDGRYVQNLAKRAGCLGWHWTHEMCQRPLLDYAQYEFHASDNSALFFLQWLYHSSLLFYCFHVQLKVSSVQNPSCVIVFIRGWTYQMVA